MEKIYRAFELKFQKFIFIQGVLKVMYKFQQNNPEMIYT